MPNRKDRLHRQITRNFYRNDPLAERPIFWHFPAYLPGANVAGAKDALMRGRPCGAVRKGSWKLLEFFEDGDLELYNLSDDIGEKNNLAAKMPDKAKELHQLLRDWRKATNAPVPDKKNPQYDPNAKPSNSREKPE